MEPDAALTDDALDRELERALAVEPSPQFLARVRTRIATEPAESSLAALTGGATSEMWRRAFALRWWTLAAAAVIVVLVAVGRNRAPTITTPTLVARAFPDRSTFIVPFVAPGFSGTLPDVASRSSRTIRPGLFGPGSVASLRGPAVGAAHGFQPLINAREATALRRLVAGVRDGRVDLTPLLQPAQPPAMDLPPVSDIVISPIIIEPIAPIDGAQGERQ